MKEWVSFGNATIRVHLNVETLALRIDTPNLTWEQERAFKPYLQVGEDQIPLERAIKKAYQLFQDGLGSGIKVSYGEMGLGESTRLEWCFKVWVPQREEKVYFECYPIEEEGVAVTTLAWPGPLTAKEQDETSYTVLPLMQGVIIPHHWPKRIAINEIEDIEKGRFYTRSSYMPWWGQVTRDAAYLAIAKTPWDGGYTLSHEAGGPTTIGPVWYPSLGKMGYARQMMYQFLGKSDYNDLCKIYREEVKARGELRSLREKALANPAVNSLVGAPIIHTHIYIHVEPTSLYYDHQDLERNELLETFEARAGQLEVLKAKGIEKAIVHIDGWGVRGYDNQHPDIFPPCEAAGGWEGMKALGETCKRLGYKLVTHDQYRDYYLDAKTYDESHTVKNQKGERLYECIWAGGAQSVLCPTLAPDYLRRNIDALKQEEIALGGVYLDVFSVIGLDECFDKEHPLTREGCIKWRLACMSYLRAQGLLTSSEETVDWSLAELDFCYRSNYTLEPQFNLGEPIGIPVPLFNLVYHDCVVSPWFLRKGGYEIPAGESGFLHTLLNGGTCYLEIEGEQKEREQAEVVCKLHQKVAYEEMVRHEWIDGNSKKQRTTFANGITVEVDFEKDTYQIFD